MIAAAMVAAIVRRLHSVAAAIFMPPLLPHLLP